MSAANNDQILVEKYLLGDEESLDILIQSYLKPIYSFVYRYVGNAKDAEDITQEVFLKVWRHIKKFDRNRSFKTWLFTIAKNTALDILKKNRASSGGKKEMPFSDFIVSGEENEEAISIFENISDPAALPIELLERKDLKAILDAAMEKLDLKYRMVLFLRYNDHFSFQEISESLEEPVDTVKSRHRRALIKLRELLQDKKF